MTKFWLSSMILLVFGTLLARTATIACVDEEDTRAERLTLHTSATDGFSILYPKGWKKPAFLESLRQRGLPMESLRFAVESPVCALNMQVHATPLEKPMNVREYVDALRAKMKNHPLRPKIVTEEETRVGDLKAVKQCIELITPTSGSPMKNVALRVVRGSVVWEVIFGGDPRRMDESRSTADEVLASFTLFAKRGEQSSGSTEAKGTK